MPEEFRERARAQLKLALLGDCGCGKTLSNLELAARSSGLTGAEIDAALDGRSFAMKTTVVLAFACALKSGEAELIRQTRKRALRLGLKATELAAVEEEAKAIVASVAQ